MTRDKLIEIVNGEYNINDAIVPGDLTAMQILNDARGNKNGNVIQAAEHDIVYFAFDIDADGWKLSDTEARILNLCGIIFDEDLDCFCRYV